MKKVLTAGAAMAMVLSMASMGAMAEGDTVDVNVIAAQYGQNTADWWAKFVEDFNADNPGINLNVEVVSWNDIYTVVNTRIANGEAPDVLNIDVFADYQADDLLLPIQDVVSEETYSKMYDAFLAQSEVDGTVWAIPDLASARAMYYNKDILDAAGVEVPTTWDELKAACEALKAYDDSIYPWGIDMTTDEGQAAFAYYTWNNGGGFVDDEGNWTLNSEQNVEAIQYAIDLVNSGYTNTDPANDTRYDLQDMFGAGKLAMVIAPNSLPTYIATKGYTDVNYAVADIPHNEGKTSSSVGVMDRIMAFKDDSAPDQAARNEAIGKFLTFFYDPENYVGWVSMEDFLPAVNSAVAALVEANPSFEAWLNVLDGCKFYPTAKTEWIDVKQGAAAVEQSALTGGDVKTLLDELQAKITK